VAWRRPRALFHRPRRLADVATITTTPRFDFTSPQRLFKTGIVADWLSQRFVATADGERFLFNMLPEGDKPHTTTTLHVILNWHEELKQAFPRADISSRKAMNVGLPRPSFDPGPRRSRADRYRLARAFT
jgi:hypothetical protein